MYSSEEIDQAERLLAACRKAGLRIATAESCTGGLVAACLTHVAGSSDVFERGFVTYSDAAKIHDLEIADSLIADFGAVSDEVAYAMAAGALSRSGVELAVSVTGVAGPGGATPAKPVGLVYFAAARRDDTALVERHVFAGDRAEIRRRSVSTALGLLLRLVEG